MLFGKNPPKSELIEEAHGSNGLEDGKKGIDVKIFKK
jgi:hypothetical protein